MKETPSRNSYRVLPSRQEQNFGDFYYSASASEKAVPRQGTTMKSRNCMIIPWMEWRRNHRACATRVPGYGRTGYPGTWGAPRTLTAGCMYLAKGTQGTRVAEQHTVGMQMSGRKAGTGVPNFSW
eukprot:1971849-Rhodomonas_salina.2